MRPAYRNICILLFAGFGNLHVLAQTYRHESVDSLTGAVNKVNVFKEPETEKPKSGASESTLPAAEWVLKCNPVILIRGQVPVYVERRLSRTYSVEAAAGITFEDYLKDALLLGKPILQKSTNTDKLSGFCAKASVRYFPWHAAMSEVYISPELDYTNYRKDVLGVYLNSDGRYTNGKLRDHQDYLDFRIILGFQNTDNYDSDFYFDWFIGAGLRAGSEDNVIPEEGNPNAIRIKHTDVLNPTVCLGVKIGLGF